MSISAAAKLLGITTLRARSDDGTVPIACTLGGKRRYNQHALEAVRASGVILTRQPGLLRV